MKDKQPFKIHGCKSHRANESSMSLSAVPGIILCKENLFFHGIGCDFDTAYTHRIALVATEGTSVGK